MKKWLLLTALAGVAVTGLGQTKGGAKLYGYVQHVSKGTPATTIEEGGGRTITGQPAAKHYLLYATARVRLYPTEIWVEGVRYGVTAKTVSSPVQTTDITGTGQVTLVPATPQKVTQLILRPVALAKASGTAGKRLAGAQAVVLIYRQNGKLFYASLPVLKELEAAAMQ